MQPNSLSFASSVAKSLLFDGELSEGFQSSRILFFSSLLLFQGGGMDISKVGEKILSSVRSARSLGLLPSISDRPEVFVLMRMQFSCYSIFNLFDIRLSGSLLVK